MQLLSAQDPEKEYLDAFIQIQTICVNSLESNLFAK